MVTSTSVTTTEYIGPQTINIGDLASAKAIRLLPAALAGQTRRSHSALARSTSTRSSLSLVDIYTTTTTTTTDLLTQDYNLIGVPAAVPEPSTWALFCAGFIGLGGIFRQRTRDRAHPGLSECGGIRVGDGHE